MPPWDGAQALFRNACRRELEAGGLFGWGMRGPWRTVEERAGWEEQNWKKKPSGHVISCSALLADGRYDSGRLVVRLDDSDENPAFASPRVDLARLVLVAQVGDDLLHMTG